MPGLSPNKGALFNPALARKSLTPSGPESAKPPGMFSRFNRIFEKDTSARRPKQQTSVAIGIKTVTALNRVRVGAFHGFEAGKGRNQHEERRARQVKIRQQNIDRTKAITGSDEDRRFIRESAYFALLRGRALQQPE